MPRFVRRRATTLPVPVKPYAAANAVNILLASAADRGRRSTDQVTGTVLLDITRGVRLAKRRVEAARIASGEPTAS